MEYRWLKTAKACYRSFNDYDDTWKCWLKRQKQINILLKKKEKKTKTMGGEWNIDEWMIWTTVPGMMGSKIHFLQESGNTQTTQCTEWKSCWQTQRKGA